MQGREGTVVRKRSRVLGGTGLLKWKIILMMMWRKMGLNPGRNSKMTSSFSRALNCQEYPKTRK